MKQHRRAPPKDPHLLEKIRVALEESRYRLSHHAIQRQGERRITLPNILYVLRNGYEERRKSTYDEEHRTWKYAIRGKTVDGDDLRIVVALPEGGVFVITVIRLVAETGEI